MLQQSWHRLRRRLHTWHLYHLCHWAIARPRRVLAALAAVTLLLAFQIPDLVFRTAVADLIIKDLPETRQHNIFKAIFGDQNLIQVVIRCPNVFDPASFAAITRLSAKADAIKGVRQVISLPAVKAAVDVSHQWPLEKFAVLLGRVDLFARNLISDDHRTTTLTLVLANDADHDQVITAVGEMIRKAGPGPTLYQIGMPLVSKALADYTQRDFVHLPPITFVLVAVVLLVLLRRWQFVVLPLLSVSVSLVWSLGLMALMGLDLSILTMMVPVLLIAVGTAYCLHIVAAYMDGCRSAPRSDEAARQTFERIAFPTALAVATTLFGLGSLVLNRIQAIDIFAVSAGLAMLVLVAVLLVGLPALLAVLPLPSPAAKSAPAGTRWVDRLIDAIVRLNLNHQKKGLGVLAVMALFCVVGMFRLQVETNPMRYFRADTDIHRHFNDVAAELAGSFPLNVTMTGPVEDYFEDPANVADLARLQHHIDTLDGVDKTISFADYLKLVNYAVNQFDPEAYALPTQAWQLRMLINNYKNLLGQHMLSPFMNGDMNAANILLLTHVTSSRRFLQLRDQILGFARQHFLPTIQWQVTGFGMVVSASSHHLTTGQLKSLAMTLTMVFAVMFALFLSVKVGLITLVPNIFPIIVSFGIMGWMGIELSMITALIGSIAIGLAVDDTIHYMVRYNTEFKKDLDARRALRVTLRRLGRPILFTTVTIAVGFSVLGLSSFKPTAVFGFLLVITMTAALVGDLILLPSLLLHVELVTLWDLVRIKMGKAPSMGIPLFRGLTRAQVHCLIMAGTLKRVQAGDVLFYKGQSSDSMYAVISGRLDVFDYLRASDDHSRRGIQKRVSRLAEGDVVGEMGLIRAVQRSATVVASRDAELLPINWNMIRRLQWLYPPVAHRFFFNLMRISCDRLENATQCLADESRVDDFTGLCNTRGFKDRLNSEMGRCRRYGQRGTLCLMQVRFAEALQSFGPVDHQDKMLRTICDVLPRQIRQSDVLGRLEPEVFGLLLPQADTDQARQICRRLYETLKKDFFGDQRLPFHIDLVCRSFDGVGTMPPSALMADAFAGLEKNGAS